MADTMREMGELLHNTPDMIQALRRSIEENAELRRKADEYFKERIRNLSADLVGKAEVINGVKVVVLSGVRVPEVVKGAAFESRIQSPEKTAFIAATCDVAGKPLLTVALTDDLVADGFNASQMVREAAKMIQGGGGGQPGFAQAGGKNRDGLTEALQSLYSKFK